MTAQRGTVECQAHLLTYTDEPRVSLVKALQGLCVYVLHPFTQQIKGGVVTDAVDDWMSKGHAQFPISDSHRSNSAKWSIGILIAFIITVSLKALQNRVPC